LSALCLWEADCRTKRHKHSLNKGPLPLHTRRRVIEAVLNEIVGLHNKPKAEVHSVHKLMGPKKKKKKNKVLKNHKSRNLKSYYCSCINGKQRQATYGQMQDIMNDCNYSANYIYCFLFWT